MWSLFYFFLVPGFEAEQAENSYPELPMRWISLLKGLCHKMITFFKANNNK